MSAPGEAPLWRRARRVMRKNRVAVAGGLLVLVMAILAALAPWLAKADPLALDTSAILRPPSPLHPLGTDDVGRDVWSRVLYGARLSLRVGLLVVILSTAAGTAIGLVAGYYPRLDGLLMRVMDGLMAFPGVLLAIAILAMLGPNEVNVALAITVVYVPRVARVVRGSVLSLREADFIQAARSLGASDDRIILAHVLPNCMAPLIVQATFTFAYAVLAEASLSFLGVGAPPPAPSWGNILADGQVYIRQAWWMTIFPGVAIIATVLGLNLFGDAMRDALDPRMD